MIRKLALPLSLALLFPACNERTKTFVSFDDLCPAMAEDVCAAQAANDCCEAPGGADACEKRVEAACTAQVDVFAENDDLVYDGERANRVRDQQRDALDQCKPPFPVGRFFVGTKDTSEACEDASECTSGVCGDGACLASDVAPLCEQ